MNKKIFLFTIFLYYLLISLSANEISIKNNERELPIPSNVTIQLSDSLFTISWNEVQDAESYKIYASDMPDNGFYDVSYTGNFIGTTWQTTFSQDNKKFFYVTAILKMQLNINVSDGILTLSWDEIPNASSYLIFASDEIEGTYNDVSASGVFNNTTWQKDISQYDIRFYYVVSIINGNQNEQSEKVGFKKFDCKTTDNTNLNFISATFAQGEVMASEFAASFGDCDAVSRWNAQEQCWESANNAGYRWLNNFEIQDGYSYLINITTEKTIYIAGKIINQPTYNLITTDTSNLNGIMVPINKNDLNLASQMGNDIGVCNSVCKFNNQTQGWNCANNGPFGWAGDFSISVGMPLLVNIDTNTFWPQSNKNINKSEVK